MTAIGNYKLTKKSVNKLYKDLSNRSNEKDVENAWREFFSDYYNSNSKVDHELRIFSPYETDGYMEVDAGIFFFLRILMEFKNGTDLNKATDRARIATQCVHYLKKFADNGEPLPNVIIGADENQIFVLYAPNFYPYLDKNYSWDIAPSSAWKEDYKMFNDLLHDNNLSVWVYNLDNITPSERFNNLKGMLEEIEELTKNNGKEFQIKVTQANIAGLFSEFERIAFTKNNQVSPRTAVNIFMQTMVGNNDEYYQKPTNPNQLHTDNGYITINGAAMKAFFKHFDRNIKPVERDKMFAMADRLIEDQDRREKGDFWTPTIWAKRADEMLKEVISPQYKENTIIWDCAAGTKNLTRDYIYSNLYSSTLFSSELAMGGKYNPEAVAFQYDFLNDDVDNDINTPQKDWKMPSSLLDALRKNDTPIVFYTNPPYGTSGKLQKDGTSKTDMSSSKINSYMKKEKYGKAAQQLYAQFYARILKLVDDFQLKDVYIAFFNNTRHFSGGDYWLKFNQKLFSRFELIKANMFNAGEFSDTANTWPITFSIYRLRKEPLLNTPEYQTSTLAIEKSTYDDQGNYIIKDCGLKHYETVYADTALSEWMKEPLKEIEQIKLPIDSYPKLSSAMGESKGKKPTGTLYKNSLGYIMNSANNVGEGSTNGGVWIGTSAAYHGHGINIFPSILDRVVVNFASRRSITSTWINAQDNFKAPNTSNPVYEEFVNDALVFSLFDTASNQASYRDWKHFTNINRPGKFINQWFWLSKEYVLEKANKYNQKLVYDDARSDNDRYIYTILKQRKLSKEAQRVLDLATLVWNDQIKLRDNANIDMPDKSLIAWDAGWFQMKLIDKIFPSNNMELLKQAINTLKDKIADNVYMLNILKH